MMSSVWMVVKLSVNGKFVNGSEFTIQKGYLCLESKVLEFI